MAVPHNDRASSAAVPKVGDTLLGKYRIDAHIGEGGMGVVLEAYHLKLEQPVALKILLPEAAGSPDAAARFAREGRAAARLQGVHVARVYDVEVTPEGLSFLVMERLRGEDLATRLAREGRLPPEQAVNYILQACEGLAEAHAKGVVHRDLKPANLYLARIGDGSTVLKLLDFGISKLLFGHGECVGEPTLRAGAPAASARPAPARAPASIENEASLTGVHGCMGTPKYMAPEQVLTPMNVDERADIWSLGVILYELLTGQPPFDGSTETELLIRVAVDAAPPIPAGLAVPAGLKQVVDLCLMKDCRERHANVLALAEALVPFGGVEAHAQLARIAGYAGRQTSSARLQRTPTSRYSKTTLGLAVAVACAAALAVWINYAPDQPEAAVEPAPGASSASERDTTVPRAVLPPVKQPPVKPAQEANVVVPVKAVAPVAGERAPTRGRSRNPLNVDIRR